MAGYPQVFNDNSLHTTKQRDESSSSNRIIFIAALLVLLFLTALFTVTSLLWFVGVSVSLVSFVLSLAVTLITAWFLNNRKLDAIFMSGVIVFFAVVFFTVLAMGMIYDISYDGNSYHKFAIGHMANGWNPLQGSSSFWIMEQDFLEGLLDARLWVDHYAKASWAIGANFYLFTGNIEAAKAFNLLSMFALFGILAFYLKGKGMKSRQCYAIASLAAVNPITVTQFVTLYNDGFMMIMLFCVVLGLAMLWDRDRPIAKPLVFVILFCSSVLCINIKFTGLAYAGIFCVVWFFAFAVRYSLEKETFVYKVKKIGKLAGFFTACLLVGVVITGYSTYVMNYQDHGNPLFPLAGEGKVDIITTQEPASFPQRSPLSRLYHSVFSESANIQQRSALEPQLKLPFTVNPSELSQLAVPDLRIAGYGVLSSGIFVLSAALLLFVVVRGLSRNKSSFALVCLINCLVICVLLLLPMTESWWARYAIYLYMIVVFALVALFRMGLGVRMPSVLKTAAMIFALIVTINTTITGYKVFEAMGDTQKRISNEMQSLNNYAETKDGQLEICLTPLNYRGLAYSIRDLGIDAVYLEEKTEDMRSAYDKHISYR